MPSNIREIKIENDEEDRASRMARRAEREQLEKRRARSGKEDGSASTPGASAVSNTGSSTANRTERMRSRAEEEIEAKRRARNDGRGNHHHHHHHSRPRNHSPHRSRNDRRSQEEEIAKRRARAGDISSAATPGAQMSYSKMDSVPVPNAGGALELQAELVSEDEQMSKMTQEMMHQNERLRQQMAAQNEMMRRQMENENAALRSRMNANDEDASNGDEGKSFPTSYKIAIAVVIVAIVAAVGAYLGTRGSSSASLPAVISDPTELPTGPPAIAEAPMPTSAPTPVLGVFPKPSVQDCSRVAAGEPVQGQSNMPSKRFKVEQDISLKFETDVDTVIEAIRAKTKSILIPNLVGCNERRRLKARLSALERNRYAIANSEVVSVTYDENKTCVSTGAGPCYHLITTLKLFLKEDTDSNTASDFILQSVITGVYDAESLAVELGSLIDSISIGKVGPVQAIVDATSNPTTTTPVSTLPPTPGPTPPPTDQPVAMPSNPPTAPPDCAANCQGDDSCLDSVDSNIGCGSCIGTFACGKMINAEIGEGSCTAKDACGNLRDVRIGSNSCLGANSCLCLERGADIGDNDCQNEGDCCDINGAPKNVPDNSCGPEGAQSCRFASGPIGGNSCNDGTRTCYKSKADIGSSSCNDGGCDSTLGEILDNACNGSKACPKLTDMIISKNACNCDSCCACLEGTGRLKVPPDSCNTLAPNKSLVDFVNGATGGPFKHCCSN